MLFERESWREKDRERGEGKRGVCVCVCVCVCVRGRERERERERGKKRRIERKNECLSPMFSVFYTVFMSHNSNHSNISHF